MSASMEAMQRAAALYHAGELHRAEELCRGVLGTHADHFDALSLLAVIVARTRRPEEAAGLLERALAARPAEPTTHNNYGNVLRELDRPGQALESYRRALRLMPDYADAHFNEANTLCHLQRLPEALEGYGRAVQIRPDYVGAHYNRALTLHALGRLPEALDSFDHVLRLKPDFALALSNRASVLYTLGRFAESAEDCARVLRIKADSAEAWYNHGNALRALGRLQAALESYGQALTLRPDYIEAHHNRGVLLHELERFDEALGSYAAALRLRPDYAAALYNQGVTLHGLKRFEEALESYEQALRIKPDYFEAHTNRGNTLLALKRYRLALDSYDRAINLRPDSAEIHFNRGVALHELGSVEEAHESYGRALALRSGYLEAHVGRGNASRELGRYDEALDGYSRALGLKADSAELHGSLGHVLHQLRRCAEALRHYDRALALRPDWAEGHGNRGAVLQALGRYAEALESYGRALELEPEAAPTHFNCGHVLAELERFDEALASYTRALELQPGQRWLLGVWLHVKMRFCDWNAVAQHLARLLDRIREGEPASLPFCLLGLSDSLELQRRAGEIWVRESAPAATLPPPRAYGAHAKIRLGYYSADFHSHATAYLAAQLFELHDRERFELVAFSFGPPLQDDPMRLRLAGAFDRFLDVRTMSDMEVARLSRELEIDIAVDLKGFTQHERSAIFAHRAAPVQVSYLGYPATMGAPWMDYLIADPTLIPESSRVHYAEKIVYLPHSYQVNDRTRAIAAREFSRLELGLPEVGFVYCCFNSSYKITPELFDSWMRILRNVQGSVLWLLEDSDRAAANLRREAEARGVAPARLVFAPRMSLPEHLARQTLADLFLDTSPCNAHTTASDALWAGLPLLTRSGESFAARVGASLLSAVGLPELITTTEAQYEALAIELARDPARLAVLRARLAGNRLSAPLFDTPRFTRHLESAYLQMHQRSRQLLQPENIFIEP
jgi:predicted O-linked N-acetylglucosamine transferase (SPINDLY family)